MYMRGGGVPGPTPVCHPTVCMYVWREEELERYTDLTVCNVARWPKFWPKSSKGAGEKKIWPEEFMAELWPNFVKSGRKGAEEIF